MKPQISFVLPTYNRVAWLAECVESILKQTVQFWELVIVDDCSTDSTGDLLEYYRKLDSRINVIYNEKNMGAGPSRNIGTQAAQADIVAVCDSDDFYPADRAAVTIAYFKEHPECEHMNGAYTRAGYGNEFLKEFPSGKIDRDGLSSKSDNTYYCHPAAAYRRDVALKIPYKRETKEKTDDRMFLEDWFEAGKSIEVVPNVLCFHRVLPGSMMTEMRGGSLE